MTSESLYNALAVDELPLSSKIEGSDLEVRTAFHHSGIFNNDLFAHQKDFLFSDDIGNGAIFTRAGSALHSCGIKHLFLYLIHIVVR